ncbi:MAG TPA: VWA domain-containing protein [Bryobacteraceae bacterium]|jgi:VWFA-related protein|nr:VWA domain-containing protein [Bryobacteraceae bacterium]
MSPLYRIAAASACAILLVPAALPQAAKTQPAPAAAQQPTFSSTATEVIVPVTVTDNKGKFVSNLVASDFRVLDEGKPQRIQFFSHAEKQPIVVGFLVDQSNNMKIHWSKYEEALEELVYDLLPGDPRYAGYLITYSNEPELKVNTTSDSEKLLDQIRKLKPAGGAAMYDAIYKACTTRSLIKGEPYEPRRIIIIVGDGHDSASSKTMAQVLELAKRQFVTIYAVNTTAFGMINEDRDTLERLANETGGHVEYPLDNPYKDVSGYLSNPQDAGNYAMVVGTGAYSSQIAAGITRSVASLLGEITTQYVLRYIPDVDADAKPKVFRRIKVDVPSLPNVIIHARDGYYPNPVPGSAPPSAQ